MDEYSLMMSENRKVGLGLSIKPNTTKSKPSNREEILHPSVLSKDKRNTGSRRQQRHSTEIGAEYYRWWAVRSSLGFQTNEHIAGLLLDGFHALLQHLVVSCGGEEYSNKNDKGSGDNKGKCDYTYAHGIKPTTISSSLPLPQTNRAFASSFSSPPGAEEMEGFSDFNNAIVFYTNSLWCMCAQPESGLHKLKNASPALQDFIVRLIGYIRGGRGFTLHDRKRNLTKDGLFCAGSSPQVNSSLNFHLMNLNPRSMADVKSPFVNIEHSGGFPCFPSSVTSGSAPFTLQPSNISTIAQNSFRGVERRQSSIPDIVEKNMKAKEHARSMACNPLVERSPTKDSSFSGKKRLECGKSSPGPVEQEPPNFLTDEPSKSAIGAECSYGSRPDNLKEKQKWPLTREISNTGLPKCQTTDNFTKGADKFTPFGDKNTAMKGENVTWAGKGQNVQFSENRYGSYVGLPGKNTVPPLHPVFPSITKDKDIKGLPSYAPTQGTPLLFFPAQSISGPVGPVGNLPSVVQKLLYNSPLEGFSGHHPSTLGTGANHRPQFPALPISDLVPYAGHIPRQRHGLMSPSTTASHYMPPLLSSRLSSISQSSMVPLLYSPAMSLPLRMQATADNVSWASAMSSYNAATKQGIASHSIFGCNQNHTMRDNFSLFKIYQDTSSKPIITGPHHPESSVSPTESGVKTKDTHQILADEYFFSKRSRDHDFKSTAPSSVYPSFLNNQDNTHCDYENNLKDSDLHNRQPYSLPKTTGKSEGSESREKHHALASLRQCQFESDEKDSGTCDLNVNNNCFDNANKCDLPPYSLDRYRNEEDERDDTRPPTSDSLITILLSKSSHQTNNETQNSKMLKLTSSVTSTHQKPFATNLLPLNETFESTAPSEKATNTDTASSQASRGSHSHEQLTRSHATSDDTVCRVAKSFKPRRFVCTTCSVVFYSGTDLLVHRYDQHSYVCGECDGRFLSTARLQQHKDTDHPQMLLCSYCRFSSFCKDTMEAHKRSKHFDITEECPTAKREASSVEGSNEGMGRPLSSQDETHDSKPKPVSYKINFDNQRHDRHQRPIAITDQSQESTFSTDKQQMRGLFLGNIISNSKPSSDNRLEVKSSNIIYGQDEAKCNTATQKVGLGAGAPCPGSVFPSFNRSMAHHMTSSKVDNIISMFSQVNDYCRFEPMRFLTPVSEDSGEMECKESVLVIDTDTDGACKETYMECHAKKDSHLDKEPCEKAKNNRKPANPTTNESNKHHSLSLAIPGEKDAESTNPTNLNYDALAADGESRKTGKSQPPGKSKKNKRKAPSVKNANKKFKTAQDCIDCKKIDDQESVKNMTKLVQTNEGTSQTAVQINEKNAQNSSIKIHRVWLDDVHDPRELSSSRSGGNDTSGTWATLQPIEDNGRNNNPSWRVSPKPKKRNRYNSPGDRVASSDDSVKQEPDVQTRVTDSLNARVLSLRERHRSHSLPPKKRGIRKAHSEVKMNDSEKPALIDVTSCQTPATCPVKQLL